MLRFALVMSLLGIAAAVALLVVNEWSPIENPTLLLAQFGGVVLAFGAAVIGHPKSTHSGGKARLSPLDTIRSAPWWSTALVVASVVLLLVFVVQLPEMSFAFATRADLVGRPDRVRAVVAFFNVFYANALHVALSGLNEQRKLLEERQANAVSVRGTRLLRRQGWPVRSHER